jgi:hypothetical protein
MEEPFVIIRHTSLCGIRETGNFNRNYFALYPRSWFGTVSYSREQLQG